MGRGLRLVAISLMLFVTAGCQLQVQNPVSQFQPAQQLPDIRGTYLDLGRSLLASNQPDLAHDAFIRSIRVEGLTAAALTGAGLASERQGLLHDAKRYFLRAKTMEPASVLANNNLGVVLYRLEEYNAAKQAFQAAFALSSGTNKVAQHNLGLTEFAIARELDRGLALAENPTTVQRLGSGVYTLSQPATVGEEG